MEIYFIILLLVGFTTYLVDYFKSKNRNPKLLLMLSFLSLLIVSAGRSKIVGTDTGNYIRIYENFSYSFWEIFGINSNIEPGYFLLNYIAKFFSEEYWALLFIIAFISLSLMFISIYKNSMSPYLSIFLLLTLGFYTFHFNGARQGLALAIYSLSLQPLVKGDFKKYIGIVFIAFLFHRSILVSIPLYFIFRRDFSLKFIIISSFTLSFIILFFDSILNLSNELLSERYSGYLYRGESGASLLTLAYSSMTFFFIFFRKNISRIDLEIYDLLLNMIIFGTVIYLIVYIFEMDVNLVRVSVYFHFSILFIWPIIFKNIKTNNYYVFRTFFYIAHTIFFYIYINKMSDLVPYFFNPIILENIVLRYFI